jgi:hypothetical protein
MVTRFAGDEERRAPRRGLGQERSSRARAEGDARMACAFGAGRAGAVDAARAEMAAQAGGDLAHGGGRAQRQQPAGALGPVLVECGIENETALGARVETACGGGRQELVAVVEAVVRGDSQPAESTVDGL